ncbi:protein HEATR9 isoform X7 [Oryctolagus cuniculus]|uniref:protein HEATR9 isoform X7 n=1 Tax=Oryctolagus cuniculus TaxID=9986 RepID=UPI00222E9317|nr:protein HEATR9 isoform X6 [Oryctolagus cuniculus]
MSYERKTDIFDISRLMLKYPWLEYRDRTKELREAMAPVRLPMSCYQVPKEVYPPSPDCWRQHSQKPSVIPYCYSETPETDMHWNILYNQQEEWETQRMLAKMRDQPRYLQQETHIQNFYLPMNKLTSKAQAIPEPLEPTRDPLKWQRLKELMKSLKSPQEDEQLYAAQALGYLDVSDKFVMEALWQVGNGRSQKPSACLRPTAKAQTGSEKVKYEAYRSLAILGCLNKHVIHALIKQLKGQDEGRRMETLTGLRVALNSWAAVPKDKRTEVGDEEKLVLVLQTLMKKLVNEAALEAALCLGFLRPCSDMAQEFLLQCLCQGPKTQRMKAMRQAVVETVEELRMKPVMMNTVEEQLMDPNATTRQEAITSLGVLGFRSPQVFHLLLDMLDTEENQAVKKSLQETLVLWSSTDPWIQSKLKNKIFLAYEAPKTNVEAAFTRFRKKPETPEQLTIQDFRLARLSPLLIAKASTKMDQKKRLPAFLPCLPQDMGHSP